MIITDMKALSESDRRLFRKKRHQITKKTSLKRLKNGVYFLPFENPVPSEDELMAFELVEDLVLEFRPDIKYFYATEVEPQHVTEGTSSEAFFLLTPIRKSRSDEGQVKTEKP
jgi:predicted transcriptional regulator of viral defense system